MVASTTEQEVTFSGEDLIRRCQDVGWVSQDNSDRGVDGVRFTLPGGGTYVVRETYASARSLKIAENELLKRGLRDAETANSRAQETLDKFDVPKPVYAAPAVFSAANSNSRAALMRAAGNYLTEPKDVGIEWFTFDHPAPLQEWVYVTPEIADFLLKNHNKPGAPGAPGSNRPQSDKRVEYYRDTIVSGQWHLTHQGMAMDTNKMVQDGQHRLAAIVAAGELIDGLKVPVAFFVGMPPENFAAIDDVLLRKAAALFTMRGEASGSILAAATRLVVAYGSASARARLRAGMNNLDILDSFDADGSDEMRASAVLAARKAKNIKMTPAAFAAAHFVITSSNQPGNKYVEAFFDGLLQGHKANTKRIFDDDDPRGVLRKTMFDLSEKKRRPRPVDQMGMLIMTWNNVVNGLHPRYLRFVPGETEIPKVVLCDDRGPNRSSTPRALYGEIEDADGGDDAPGEGADGQ